MLNEPTSPGPVEGLPRAGQLVEVVPRPGARLLDQVEQRATERGQQVLDYYASIVTGGDQHWRRPHRRLVAVGLTATVRLDSGGAVMDDPALFPPRLTPFATAHARLLSALRNTTALDWAVLTPPTGFGTGPVEREYRLVTEPVTQRQAAAALRYLSGERT